ncbi:alginate lyase-domain-containing protein [Hyaloraphidium curvatum]|nr:alginate lyase-domain-containing protein [Hyaloraphidium curvatum]
MSTVEKGRVSPPGSEDMLSPPSPAAGPKRPWYRHPLFLAACGVLAAAAIAVPTAIVVTNNSKTAAAGAGASSGSGAGTPGPAVDADADDDGTPDVLTYNNRTLSCRRQDRSYLNISLADAGVADNDPALNRVQWNGTVKVYPKDPVKNLMPYREMDYPVPAVGPFAASPPCWRPSPEPPAGADRFQPFLPCILGADPIDIHANYYLSRSAASSRPFAAALTTLFDGAEADANSTRIYTVTNKKVFPLVQNPRDPHAFFHAAPYYFPDPTCVDKATGKKDPAACPYIHCPQSLLSPDNRASTDVNELLGTIRAVGRLALRAYFAGAEFEVRGPSAGSLLFAQAPANATFRVAGTAGNLTVRAADVAADQARYVARAQRILSAFFLAPDTFMRPNFTFAGYAHGWPAQGAFFGQFTKLIDLVDSITLLESLPAWNTTRGGVGGEGGAEITAGLRRWFSDLYEWHATTPATDKDQERINNIGQWVDAVWVSVAHYAGRAGAPASILAKVPTLRLQRATNTEGELVRETVRTASYGYSTFSLNALATLASQADRYAGATAAGSTKNLGGFWTWYDAVGPRNSSTLQRAVDFIVPYLPGAETFPGSGTSNLTGKPFEIAGKPWPFPNDKVRTVEDLEFVRTAYHGLGGAAGEAAADARMSTRRYRVAWEEANGVPWGEWDGSGRLMEPA